MQLVQNPIYTVVKYLESTVQANGDSGQEVKKGCRWVRIDGKEFWSAL